MGSIDTYADLLDLRRYAPLDRIYPCKTNITKVHDGGWVSYWAVLGQGAEARQETGVAPTTAVVPTRATVGSFGQRNPSAGKQAFIDRVSLQGSTAGSVMMIADRLSHQGGLDGTVTTSQTTNLPTAALTRYTYGEGVIGAPEIYTQIGATATTVVVTYTNQAGTGGRTSPPFTIGGSGYREVGRLLPIPLQSGDYGIRSVQSVDLLATTGTAGNFGVSLFKFLCPVAYQYYSNQQIVSEPVRNRGGFMPEVLTDACLCCVDINSVGSGANLWPEIIIVEA